MMKKVLLLVALVAAVYGQTVADLQMVNSACDLSVFASTSNIANVAPPSLDQEESGFVAGGVLMALYNIQGTVAVSNGITYGRMVNRLEMLAPQNVGFMIDCNSGASVQLGVMDSWEELTEIGVFAAAPGDDADFFAYNGEATIELADVVVDERGTESVQITIFQAQIQVRFAKTTTVNVDLFSSDAGNIFPSLVYYAVDIPTMSVEADIVLGVQSPFQLGALTGHDLTHATVAPSGFAHVLEAAPHNARNGATYECDTSGHVDANDALVEGIICSRVITLDAGWDAAAICADSQELDATSTLEVTYECSQQVIAAGLCPFGAGVTEAPATLDITYDTDNVCAQVADTITLTAEAGIYEDTATGALLQAQPANEKSSFFLDDAFQIWINVADEADEVQVNSLTINKLSYKPTFNTEGSAGLITAAGGEQVHYQAGTTDEFEADVWTGYDPNGVGVPPSGDESMCLFYSAAVNNACGVGAYEIVSNNLGGTMAIRYPTLKFTSVKADGIASGSIDVGLNVAYVGGVGNKRVALGLGRKSSRLSFQEQETEFAVGQTVTIQSQPVPEDESKKSKKKSSEADMAMYIGIGAGVGGILLVALVVIVVVLVKKNANGKILKDSSDSSDETSSV